MPKEIAERIVREIIKTGSDGEREELQKFYEKWGSRINANLLPQPIRAFMKLAEKEKKETGET
ncbi:MAG: hypothetical protein WA977_07405 [Halobacteriota archaeon]